MSPRQLLRLTIALAVAFFLWGAFELFGGRGDEVRETQLLPPLTQGEVNAVLFARDADTVRLARTDGTGWTVNGFATAPSAVEELFAAVADGLTGRVVAQSPSSHESMGVDDAGATRVRFERGDHVLAEILVGNRGRTPETVYARRPGENEVARLEGKLAALVHRPLVDWRDKRIVAVPLDSIQSVVIDRAGRQTTVTRADSGWTLNGGVPADSGRVARLLAEVSAVTAQGTAFATEAQADSVDFSQPERRLTLLGPGEVRLASLAFDSTSGGYWVRRGTDDTIFWLYQWKVDDLTPPDSSLRRGG